MDGGFMIVLITWLGIGFCTWVLRLVKNQTFSLKDLIICLLLGPIILIETTCRD